MSALTLAAASRIVDAALEHGHSLKLAPLTVVVLDAGGVLVAAKREDNSSLLRPEIATGKAYGALALGFGSRELARRAANAPAFMNALSDLAGGKMVPVPGGVLIRADDPAGVGAVIGAVGISGDVSDKDEACAVAGIRAAGLRPDTGDPA